MRRSSSGATAARSRERTAAWNGTSHLADLFLGIMDGRAAVLRDEQPHANARAAFDTIGARLRGRAPLVRRRPEPRLVASPAPFLRQLRASTQIERGGWSRVCPECSAQHFPRVDPVVIMLAEHDGRLLLGRQPNIRPAAIPRSRVPGARRIDRGRGRTRASRGGRDQGRRRRYIASQPWPFPSSLMIGCHARRWSTL
jgi:NAD+ diphosphatase